MTASAPQKRRTALTGTKTSRRELAGERRKSLHVIAVQGRDQAEAEAAAEPTDEWDLDVGKMDVDHVRPEILHEGV